MHYNNVLRRLRYALDLNDEALIALFDAAGVQAAPEHVTAWLLREDDPDMQDCGAERFEAFLDALIVQRRGPPPLHMAPPPRTPLTNNAILKKLRIALSLRDVDIIEILAIGGHEVTKSGLGGLFRPPGHVHYRPCGDQFLRAFFRGLTVKLRGASRS